MNSYQLVSLLLSTTSRTLNRKIDTRTFDVVVVVDVFVVVHKRLKQVLDKQREQEHE